jgi:hypothetical protein
MAARRLKARGLLWKGRGVSLALAPVAALAALAGLGLWYTVVFPRQPVTGPLPAATAEERDLARRLAAHVAAIARAPRNLEHFSALEAAARTIEATLAGLGLTPVPQPYEVAGRRVRNIEVVIEPTSGGAEAASLVIGAHYDSAGTSPGANDNATGVAALLELARLLRNAEPRRHRLRLVFWVNEEHPFGKTPDMGSWHHAKRLKDAGERVMGAISLETIGYFSDEPGSQKFPAPFGLVYSNRGNFVAFVGLPGSRALVHRAIRAFRRETRFPSIGGVAPGFIEGIDHSDHWSYHRFGYPAFMLTDTAPFRNPHYHTPTDLPETVDYESLARVTKGVERMIRTLVN